MQIFKETINNHDIEIFNNRWGGKEIIKYDGKEVSQLKKFFGSGSHHFQVKENDENGVMIILVLIPVKQDLILPVRLPVIISLPAGAVGLIKRTI